MRYAKIRKMDISNGLGVGVSLFTQGCHFHCKDCFNKETWDFDGGKPFTKETVQEILRLINRPGITRFSVLGGEPLESCNYRDLAGLLFTIHAERPDIKIWVYTGNTFEALQKKASLDFNLFSILHLADVLVDGPFMVEKKDITIPYAGSWNQRVIDLKKTFENKKIIEINLDNK